MTQKKSFFLAFLLAAISSVSVFADYNKVELEMQYTERAQRALDAVYGSTNFIVRVNIEMSAPEFRVRYTELSNPKLPPKQQQQGEKINILPGYPVIRNLGTTEENKLPFNSLTTYVAPQIEKITVDTLVNKNFPKGQAGKAQALLKTVLDLRDGRDIINFTYQPFFEAPKAPAQEIVMRTSNDLFSFQNLFNMAFAGLAAFFILVYIAMSLLKSRGAAAPKSAAGGGGPTSISVNPSFEMPKGGGGGAGGNIQLKAAPQIKSYFDFISDENIGSLISIIKIEKLMPDQIAVISSFLQPDLATKVISSLDLKDQAVAATTILRQQMVNRALLDKLEARIKDRLECMAGGESVFKNVFNLVTSDAKKKLLSALRTDPVGYKAFRGNVLIFDDVKFLDDNEMKLVISELDLERLATAMVSVDAVTSQKIETNLPGSAKDRVKQSLELKGTGTPKKDIDAAQDYVLGVLNRLEEQGKIKLRSKIKG